MYTDKIRDSNLSKSSKTMYLSKIEKIQNEIFPNNIQFIIENPALFAEKLEAYDTEGKVYKTVSNSTKLSFVSAIIAIFTYNPELKALPSHPAWVELFYKYKTPINLKYKSNTPTERQQAGYMSYDELINIRDTLTGQERLLFSMYLEIPPVRADYWNTKLVSEPIEGQNHIIGDTLCLVQYKTVEKYGPKRFKLPEPLVEEINRSLAEYPREYLFVAAKGNCFSSPTTFSFWANNIIKKATENPHMTLTMFRHIYISRRDLMTESMSVTEQEEIADKMCHSVAQQRQYSWHCWEELKN